MKTIDELRKGFEEIDSLQNRLKICYFDPSKNIYQSFMSFEYATASYLNGAWFMYQELNK